MNDKLYTLINSKSSTDNSLPQGNHLLFLKSNKCKNIVKEAFKIIRFVACSKISIYILLSRLCLVLPFNIIINTVFMLTFIFFCCIIKIPNF